MKLQLYLPFVVMIYTYGLELEPTPYKACNRIPEKAEGRSEPLLI
jgi:hypothetical protein